MRNVLGAPHLPMAHKQRGATLLVAIVFLLIITILGISSMRGVALESRITANLKQQKTLMNAAEAGLRIGESSIGTTEAPATAKACTTINCLSWTLEELLVTVDANIDTPTRFGTGNAANVATVSTGYATKIQWYVVQLGKLGVASTNDCAAKGCGVWYYEVNACASTVLCTSDTTTRRVMLRTVIARYYQP